VERCSLRRPKLRHYKHVRFYFAGPPARSNRLAAVATACVAAELRGVIAACKALPCLLAAPLDSRSLSIERLVRAGAGMELADVQQGAALETAAPPTVERQREQQRIQAPSYISPRNPGLRQLSSPADTQPHTSPAQPLLLARTGYASDSGSPVSGESAGGLAEGSGSQVPRPQLSGSQQEQGAEQRSQRQCTHCSTQNSVGNWYRHPKTCAWLCHACGCYARNSDGRLPSPAVLQLREKKRIAAPPSQRQCMQCGASTPGVRRHWARHPATKEEWLCHKCCERIRFQLKRKRQREAAASTSDGQEGSWEEGEEAQPPSQAAASPQQQAAPVQPCMPDLPIQQRARETAPAELCAGARQQQQQQLQGVDPDATWETAPEQPALLPAQPPQPQASTGLLVLEAAQLASAAAAGLTEGLAGTFAALLPMPTEQVRHVRLLGHSHWQHAERGEQQGC
jgi:hypothetical protein